MKLNMKAMVAVLLAATCSLQLVSCIDDSKNCCEGYTGKISDARADSLVKRCHFLSKDSIELWVTRYESYKKEILRQKDYNTQTKDSVDSKSAGMKMPVDNMSAQFLMGGSVSYNNCIIKKILCDKNSIGLRVLYGIGSDNKIHIILVGIQPDYSNLYVSGDDCCDQSLNKKLGAGASGASGNTGGAEYGQLP